MIKIQRLEMKDICKSFQGVHANKDINLEVSSGEILGLLGENGAGKTTLMNILYGIYQPDSGTILINGKPMCISNPVKSINLGIGMVHQHFMLIQNHSVIENIALGYKDTPFFFPRKVLRQKIKAFSSQFDFQIDLDQKVWQLSAGNIQKLILGREISEQPKLLVASHPTYGLDVGATQFLREHLLKLCRQGSSVLLFSEDLDEIFELCDRVAVIFAGEFMGILETDDERINDIGLMMAESKRIE